MNKKGFLLLEVMISIAIIAAGLFFIARAFSSSNKSLEASEELMEASLFMEDAVWRFEEAGEIEEGVNEGVFPQDERYSWRVKAEAIPEDAERALNIVTVEVFRTKEPGLPGYAISTYLANKTKE